MLNQFSLLSHLLLRFFPRNKTTLNPNQGNGNDPPGGFRSIDTTSGLTDGQTNLYFNCPLCDDGQTNLYFNCPLCDPPTDKQTNKQIRRRHTGTQKKE